MKENKETKQIIAALIKAQKAFQPAIKNAVNPFYKSKYVDLHSVIDAVEEALWKNGLTIISIVETSVDNIITTKITDNKNNKEIEYQSPITICVTTLLHESGESIKSCYPLQPTEQNKPQSLGAAFTYARRYTLMAILGIAPEDDDGNQASSKNNGKKITDTEMPPDIKLWFEKAATPDKVIDNNKKAYKLSDGTTDWDAIRKIQKKNTYKEEGPY